MVNDPSQPTRQRRFRFGLRTLLALVAILALPLGWLASVWLEVRSDHEIANYIEQHGGAAELANVGSFGLRLLQKADWRQFQRVSVVDLENAKDVDSKVIGRLSELRVLFLAAATSHDLEPLAGCAHLRGLLLFDSVQLTLDELAGSTVGARLNSLMIRGPLFDDRRVTGIDRLTGLDDLTLDKASVTDLCLHQLAKLRLLRKLQLVDCPRIRGSGLAALASLENLSYVRVEGLTLDDEAFDLLAKLPKLSNLDLLGNAVTDSHLEPFRASQRLTSLDLSGSSITDSGLQTVATMTQLEWLSLQGTPITAEGLPSLRALSKLRILKLGPNPGLSDVQELKRALPGCFIEYTDSAGNLQFIAVPRGT